MTVAVVSTGGTIASTEDAGADASPELSSEELLAAVPEIEAVTDVETVDFSTVPSTHFTVDQVHALFETIADLDREGYDGIVVTQGTDVLEESAYFVDLCYEGDAPVVFTGAMRNPSLPSPDGPANLLDSVRVATAERAEGSVLVTFNGRVHAARDVTKTNSMNVDTFRSPEFGPLAVIDEARVTWRRRPGRVDPVLDPDPDRLTEDVHAVTVTLDMPPAQILAADDAAALCLAATGAGHIPPSIVPALEALRDRGVPVVATSRCPEGRLARSTYDFEGSERTLIDLDCHFSDLVLQKTRIATIVALAAGELDAVFDRP